MLIFSMTAYAQKFDKKYTEEFKTNTNVIIDVDTRHTDIEIETWNKNIVSIEATIEVEGTTEKKAKGIIKNWKFSVLGNKNQIEIISKTNNLFANNRTIHINGGALRIEKNNYDFVMPEVSIGNLGVLDSFEVVMPDVFVFPDFDAFHFEFDTPEFDYEKYKNDESYLKDWQEKMKKSLEKLKIEMKENSVIIKENSAKLKGELKIAQEERKKALKEYTERRKEVMKLKQEKLKERAEQRKEMVKERREVQERRKEELAKRRIEIKNIIIDRDKVKIKRIIRIKAPKDAKFNMNVKYGSMSFPS